MTAAQFRKRRGSATATSNTRDGMTATQVTPRKGSATATRRGKRKASR